MKTAILNDLVECHECGKMGRGFTSIELESLCQHFVNLCLPCLRKLADAIRMPIAVGAIEAMIEAAKLTPDETTKGEKT